MISIAKYLIKRIIYGFIDLLVPVSGKIQPKSILLMRLDSIGDYILFRNFIRVLKNSDKYKEYSITLLGNTTWWELAEELDSDYIDKFIWMDRYSFSKDFNYRYKKLKEISSQGYEIVINPVYSRDFFIMDSIVRLVSAKEKIGNLGNLSNTTAHQKRISDRYYTRLLNAKDTIMFEFNRNKEFFENLLDTRINIDTTSIEIKPGKHIVQLPEKYVILFTGANSELRKWSLESYAKVGMHLRDTYGYEIVLCGGIHEVNHSTAFEKFLQGSYLDLIGKTTLNELAYVICHASLVLTNDTSTTHLSVALGVNNLYIISNGNHFGRFVPYPKGMARHYYAIFHSDIYKTLDDYPKLCHDYGYGSSLNINEITVEDVIAKLDNDLRQTLASAN